MPAIKTLLFDCDNTLVLSENAAFEACAQLANEILAHFGFEKRYGGDELMHEFVGQNFRGMMGGLCVKHGFTIPEEQLKPWVDKELGQVIANLREKAEPCKNVMPVLDKLYKDKKYELAIVSSSAMPRVVASIEKCDQDKYFGKPEEGIFSAASSIDPPTSKPNPAIYLHACKVLKVDPKDAIAIEDSRSGATAAKNAGIPLLGYVGPYYDEGMDKVKQMESLLKNELGAFAVMHDWNEFFDIIAKYESS